MHTIVAAIMGGAWDVVTVMTVARKMKQEDGEDEKDVVVESEWVQPEVVEVGSQEVVASMRPAAADPPHREGSVSTLP